jgi:hypothetical protein
MKIFVRIISVFLQRIMKIIYVNKQILLKPQFRFLISNIKKESESDKT